MVSFSNAASKASRSSSGIGAAVTQRFRVAARSVNTPPVITSVPPTEAAVDVLFTHSVRATDRDGDRLTYSLLTRPDGMMIDADTGQLFFNEINTQPGSFAFYLWSAAPHYWTLTELLSRLIDRAERLRAIRRGLQRQPPAELRLLT